MIGNILLTLLTVLGMFMILIILLQRGRGGGLAGAFGGAGGQSAFGTKAGDIFTKITIGVAIVWVLLAGISGLVLRANQESDIAKEVLGSGEVIAAEDEESDDTGLNLDPIAPPPSSGSGLTLPETTTGTEPEGGTSTETPEPPAGEKDAPAEPESTEAAKPAEGAPAEKATEGEAAPAGETAPAESTEKPAEEKPAETAEPTAN